MTAQQNDNDKYFLGIMILGDGKWTPHSKFDGGAFGSALISAEELDSDPGVEAVKVVRIEKTGSGEQKEMWVSPSLQARLAAQQSAKLRAGVQATKDNLSAERKAAARK